MFCVFLMIVIAIFASFKIAKNQGDSLRLSCFDKKNLQSCKELEARFINECNHHGMDACYNLGILNEKIYNNQEKAKSYYEHSCEIGIELACDKIK